MHGTGTFFDRRFADTAQYPIAAASGSGNTKATPDLITSKLAALHFYQIAIPAPNAPRAASTRQRSRGGRRSSTRRRSARAATWRRSYRAGAQPAHAGGEGPSIRSRRALADPQVPHRPATLKDVLAHYDRNFKLGLSDREKAELIEYLKSL